MTRLDDVLAAVDLGVDAIGLVFVPGSRRTVDLDLALAMLARVPAMVSSVALFMDAPASEVERVLQFAAPDLLQFHGSESPAYCASFGRPYVKALAMGDGLDVAYEASRYAGARGVLLDAHRRGEQGGRGERFDWSAIPANLAGSIVLAGGLSPANVGLAVRQVRPFAVDVSSGIESAPGIKSVRLMQEFINEVERASRESGPA